MRRAFDGTEIQQKPIQQQQQPQYGKQLGQPPLHPMRPSSAKPPAFNNLLMNNNMNGEQMDDSQTYQQQHHSSHNFSENNINSNRGYYSGQNQQSTRLQSGGMKRSNSGHRNYENNMLQLNRTAQQLSKINSQLNTSGVETYGGDVAKHMPRIISQDKEQLYADTLTFKNQINELKDQNKQLKTQLYQTERDSAKYKKMVDQYEQSGLIKGFYPKTEGGHITENLKRTIKDLKLQLTAKDEESNKIKKQIKFTRIQELDIERKSYAEECTRLKNLLQQALNEKMEILIKETDFQKLEERYYSLNNETEQLRYDNREMAQQLKGYDDQNNYLTRSYNDLERKSNLQINTLRKHLKERDREINELKNELSRFRLQNNNNNSSKKDFSNQLPITSNRLARPQSAKNTSFNTENGFLKKQLEMKDDKIRQLEEDVIQLRHELTTQGNHGGDDYDDDEKPLSNDYRNNQNQNIYNGQYQQQSIPPHQDDKGQQLQPHNKQNSNNNNNNNNSNNEIKIEQQLQQQSIDKKPSTLQDNEKKSIDGVLRINSDSNNQYVTRIKKEDIAHIGEELQFKLRAHGLNLGEAAQLFFENLDEKTTIRDLQAMLLDKPFNLQQNDSLLLSRYLVEDQTGKYRFEWEYSRKNEYIFQSFNDIVGTYKVFSKAYAQKLYNYLLEIFVNNRESIKATFQTKSNGNNTISKDQFISTFEFLNIQLQKDQIAFLIMTMILDSVDLNHLNYKNLLRLFKNKPNEYDEEGVYDEQGDQYVEDEDGGYEESNEYQDADQYVQEAQNNQNQVKLQRPQSSKRRNPLPNNQLEQGGGEDDEYYDQSGQGIEEDNDDEEEGQYYDDEEQEYDTQNHQYHKQNQNLNQNHNLNKDEESIIKKYADRKSSNEYDAKLKNQQNNKNNHLTPTPGQYDEMLKQKETELLKSWKEEDEEEDEQIYEESEQQKYAQNNPQYDQVSDDDLQQYVEDEFEKNNKQSSKEHSKKASVSNPTKKNKPEEDNYEEDFDDKPPTKKGSKVDKKKQVQKENNYEDENFDIVSDDD